MQVSDASEPATHVLVRVWLPDRPGALGLVASRIGAVDGDIVGIDVLERGDNVAVDEFAVLLRKSVAIDAPRARDRRGRRRERRAGAHHRPLPRPAPRRARVGRHAVRGDQRRRAALARSSTRSSGEFTADWSALLRDATLLASAGDATPDASVLEALATGTAASPRVADGTTGPDDLAVASFPTTEPRCSSGATGAPFRRRERAQLSALAGIADRTWALLA